MYVRRTGKQSQPGDIEKRKRGSRPLLGSRGTVSVLALCRRPVTDECRAISRSESVARGPCWAVEARSRSLFYVNGSGMHARMRGDIEKRERGPRPLLGNRHAVSVLIIERCRKVKDAHPRERTLLTLQRRRRLTPIQAAASWRYSGSTLYLSPYHSPTAFHTALAVLSQTFGRKVSAISNYALLHHCSATGGCTD